MGVQALYNNNNSYNTGAGVGTLYNTTNSQFNTAIGYAAGNSFDNGWNNVFVGANVDVNGTGYFNVIAVGQGTVATGSSVARFGNAASVSYGGWAGWTNLSDGRYKKNVKENVKGLDFIMKLRPITYNMDATGVSKKLNENQGKELSEQYKQALTHKEKVTYTGFIAQEVEQAANETGYDFSGVDKPKNQNDLYGLRYAEFVVPLVKGMQEQQKTIEDLKSTVEDLKKQIEEMKESAGEKR